MHGSCRATRFLSALQPKGRADREEVGGNLPCRVRRPPQRSDQGGDRPMNRAEAGRKYRVTAAHRRQLRTAAPPARRRRRVGGAPGRDLDLVALVNGRSDRGVRLGPRGVSRHAQGRDHLGPQRLQQHRTDRDTGRYPDPIRGRGNWIWCRNAQGDEGWVPEESLSPSRGTTTAVTCATSQDDQGAHGNVKYMPPLPSGTAQSSAPATVMRSGMAR